MKKGWIAYVGPISFPWGQAGSRRVCGIARALAAGGYKVIVGSGDDSPSIETALGEGEPAGMIEYIGLGESPASSHSNIRKLHQIFWAFGRKTVAWLDAQKVKPSCVIVYGGGAPYMLRLLPWCKRNNVPLIADVVEWYDPRQMAGGMFGPFNISAKIALKWLYPRASGVIAISRLLADHYAKSGCHVVRVPPTISTADVNPGEGAAGRGEQCVTLVYAGTPGRKDLLGSVIRSVASADKDGARLRLVVVGPTEEEIGRLIDGKEIPKCVVPLGRIPQGEVLEHVKSADFSVLMREPLHFANAGFPTKVVESMACGTPVITNSTSDLSLYIRDGVEGFISKDHSIESIVEVLERVLSLSREDLGRMRKAARSQAERSFDFDSHSLSLSAFLKKVMK